jgi:hypothetical protein
MFERLIIYYLKPFSNVIAEFSFRLSLILTRVKEIERVLGGCFLPSFVKYCKENK